MGKLLVLSLEESEYSLYNKIMEIINAAGINTDKVIDQEQRVVSIGELIIFPAQRKVLKRGQEVALTNIEFRILYALAVHQGNILSKEQIYNFVWNGEYLRDDSNITSHVRRLRKKIEDDPSKPTYIETVRGIGYRMNSGYIITHSTLLYTVIVWVRCPDGNDRFVTYSSRPEFVNLEDHAVYTLEELQQRLSSAAVGKIPTDYSDSDG